jgi:pimeloyl-ACP methyl ester carboxylesterase
MAGAASRDPESLKPRRFAKTLIGADGFGGRSSYKIVELYMQGEVVPSDWLFGGYRYSQKGITADDIAHTAHTFATKFGVQQTSFHGRSMGGPVSLIAATGAHRPVEALVFDSSPYDIDDARDAAAAKIAALFGKATNYTGSLQWVTAANLISEIRDTGPERFLDKLVESSQLTWRSENPTAIRKELAFIYDVRLGDFKTSLRKLLSKETVVYYAFTKDALSDETVNPLTAFDKYQELFAELGPQIIPVRYKEPGHALMEESIENVAPFLRSKFEVIDPYEARQRFRRQLPGPGRTELQTDLELSPGLLHRAVESTPSPHQRYQL